MSKIGVAIGEDFPVDDGPDRPHEPHDEHCGPYWDAREEWRRQRHEWRRQWKAEWRARKHEWRQHKRAFKSQLRDSAYEHGDYRRYYRGHGFHLGYLIPILAIAGGIAIIVALINNPLVLLALVVGGVAFVAWRRHEHYEDVIYAPPPRETRSEAPQQQNAPAPQPPETPPQAN